MAKRLARRALCAMIGFLVANVAHATPLTFYYDQASWLAAVAGFPIGTYSSGSTQTQIFVTVDYFQNFAVIGTSTVTTVTANGGFSSISNFPFSSPLGFSFPMCSFNPIDGTCPGTGLQELLISLDSPIMGFEANVSFQDDGRLGLTLNGQLLIPGSNPSFYSGFFGVVGPISTLDFRTFCSFSRCGISDSFETIRLSNIQVVVSEPPSATSFLAGILLLLLVLGLRARWRSPNAVNVGPAADSYDTQAADNVAGRCLA